MWDTRRLEALISNVPGAIYRCSPESDWAMQFLSDEIEAISGHPAAEFIGSTRAHVRERDPSRRPRAGRGLRRRGPRAARRLRARVPARARRRVGALGVRARPRDLRRGRRRAVPRRRHLRHHRPQARRGAAVAPRLPRRAHRPAQPDAVPGAPRDRHRHRRSHRDPGGGALHRPRRLQAHQRQLRPRRRRSAARRGGTPPAARDPLERHRRPAGRGRVPDPRHRRPRRARLAAPRPGTPCAPPPRGSARSCARR